MIEQASRCSTSKTDQQSKLTVKSTGLFSEALQFKGKSFNTESS